MTAALQRLGGTSMAIGSEMTRVLIYGGWLDRLVRSRVRGELTARLESEAMRGCGGKR